MEAIFCGCQPVLYDCRNIDQGPYYEDIFVYYKSKKYFINSFVATKEFNFVDFKKEFTYKHFVEKILNISLRKIKMNDIYSIYSHKLIFHRTRVSKRSESQNNWDKQKRDLSNLCRNFTLLGGCNHRCTFCGLDYMGYDKKSLDYDVLKNTLTNMEQNGVKSVMFCR